MEEETQVQDTQVSAENIPAVDGEGNGSQGTDVKDVLGEVFGTEFKTNEDALKSVEHAKNMSGKVGQLEQALTEAQNQSGGENPALETKIAELTQQVGTLAKENKLSKFYTDNPDYNIPEVKALISKLGDSPEEVVNDEVFKTTFEALKTRADAEKSQSIIHSNPRLGQVKDNMSKAQEALKVSKSALSGGDPSGAHRAANEAANAATEAVKDAFQLGQS